MSGTKAGGLKAAKTNKEKHGEDFYRKIGKVGGRLGHTGGFASSHTLAALAGAKGGRISKRGKTKHHKTKYLKELSKKYSQVTVGDVLNGHIAIDVSDKVHFVRNEDGKEGAKKNV